MKNIPPLFKYCPPDRIDVLRSNKICFSKIQDFNDPFEMNPALSFEAGTDNILALKQATRIFLDRKSVSKNWGVLALTTNSNSLPMWAHYAAGHRGFLIEFNVSDDFFQSRSRKGYMHFSPFEVKYDGKRPTCSPADFTAIETKGSDWAHENEWRMIRELASADEQWNEFHLFNLPPSAISSVTLGCKMPENIRQDIVRYLHSEPRYSHIKVNIAIPAHSDFSVLKIPVPRNVPYTAETYSEK